MTKRHRAFTTSEEEETNLEPVTFDLGKGRTKVTFTAVPEVAGSAILEFVGANDRGNAAIAGNLLPFLESALGEEEYARFREYIDDPKHHVKIEKIADIVGYLVEEYTERPTEQPDS